MNSLVSLPLVASPFSPPLLAERHDRRALEAYASWLHMERRLLCMELYPHMGAEAENFVFADNAGFGWHFRGRGDLAWNEGLQPSSRAADVLDLVGVDWRQPKRDLGLNHDDNGERPPLPANWPQLDGALRQAFDDIVAIDSAMAGLHKEFGDDADSRDDYCEFNNRRNDCISILIDVAASSMIGIQAKASALRLREMIEDYEQHQQIAVSLADDLVAFGAAAGEVDVGITHNG